MFNPILSKEEFPKFNLFQSRPTGEPGVAIVLYRDNGTSSALPVGRQITAGEITWGKYKGYYRVDVAEHDFNFQVSIPCDKDAFNFQADVKAIYRVEQPAYIVDNQIRDAETIVKTELVNIIRSISRKYNARQSQEAENEINKSLVKGLRGRGFFVSRVMTDLALEEAPRKHLRDIQAIGDNHEIQKLADQLEIERQKIKMQFYGPLIKEGQWEMLAFQLAKNPDDVATIINAISHQKHLEFERQLQALKAMLDGDVLESWQVKDVGKEVLHRLVDNLGLSNSKGLLGDTTEKKPDDNLQNGKTGNDSI